MIVHLDAAQSIGRLWCKKMSESSSERLHSYAERFGEDVVPKQQFELAIQAAIGTKVIARETLSALRKDVTAGLYGGEASPKR